MGYETPPQDGITCHQQASMCCGFSGVISSGKPHMTPINKKGVLVDWIYGCLRILYTHSHWKSHVFPWKNGDITTIDEIFSSRSNFQMVSSLPGTPNNQFLMDFWWFPTISYVKIGNHPIDGQPLINGWPCSSRCICCYCLLHMGSRQTSNPTNQFSLGGDFCKDSHLAARGERECSFDGFVFFSLRLSSATVFCWGLQHGTCTWALSKRRELFWTASFSGSMLFLGGGYFSEIIDNPEV